MFYSRDESVNDFIKRNYVWNWFSAHKNIFCSRIIAHKEKESSHVKKSIFRLQKFFSTMVFQFREYYDNRCIFYRKSKQYSIWRFEILFSTLNINNFGSTCGKNILSHWYVSFKCYSSEFQISVNKADILSFKKGYVISYFYLFNALLHTSFPLWWTWCVYSVAWRVCINVIDIQHGHCLSRDVVWNIFFNWLNTFLATVSYIASEASLSFFLHSRITSGLESI